MMTERHGQGTGAGDAGVQPGWRSYGAVAALCGLATLAAVLVRGHLAEANLVLIYLLSVVAATVRFGRGPGILASLLAVLAFDVFLVEPVHSISVADPQYLLTFAIMLTVSLIVSYLTANLQRQARIAQAQARRAKVQFELSTDLASALSAVQIRAIATTHLAAALQGHGTILLAGSTGLLDCTALAAIPGVDSASASVMAQAVFERVHDESASEPVCTAGQLRFIGLRAPLRSHGILVLFNGECSTPEQLRLLQAFAAQIALAIERVHFAEVSAATALAMNSERLRNSLLSAVSHDVRTPLAAIVGLSSTLATAAALSPHTMRELAQAIQEDALRMNDLVSNLLDLERLQTGVVHLNREWQMIDEVIGSALALSARNLGALQVELTLPERLPLVAYDAVLLERVLCNVLDNAARHASCGGWIGLAVVVTGQEIEVRISDRGPGVPEADQERIFAKFVHGVRMRERAGVGLGLAICRTIAEAHGGRIWVTPGAGGGACFTVALPLGSPPDISSMENAACVP